MGPRLGGACTSAVCITQSAGLHVTWPALQPCLQCRLLKAEVTVNMKRRRMNFTLLMDLQCSKKQ